jgi:hypothetical protein
MSRRDEQHMRDQQRNGRHPDRSTTGSQLLEQSKGLRMRSLVLGFLMTWLFALIVRNADFLRKIPWSDHRSALMVPSTAGIGVVMVLVLIVNPLFRRIKSSLCFDGRDITTVFCMVFMGSVLMSNGMFIPIIMVSGSLGYLSITSRRIFEPLIQRYTAVVLIKDLDALRGFWMGRISGIPWDGIPWSAWIGPLVFWSVIFALVWFVGVCLTTLLRRRWTMYDKLTYPLVAPIAEMYSGNIERSVPPVWKNWVLWVGCLAIVVIDGLPILKTYIPSLPVISLDAPWRALRQGLRYVFKPDSAIGRSIGVGGFYGPATWVVGAMWYVPSDLLFSLWFFDFVFKVGLVATFSSNPHASTIPLHLSTAAFTALGVFYLYIARSDLRDIFGSITQHSAPKSMGSDEDEPLPYKVALIGCVVAFIILVVLSSVFLRVSPIWPAVFFFILFMTFISVARMRVEQAVGWGGSTGWFPNREVQRLFGSRGPEIMNRDVMLGMAFLEPMASAHSSPVASLFEMYEMANRSGMSMRSLTKLVGISFGLALLFGVTILLPTLYETGTSRSAIMAHIDWWWGPENFKRVVGSANSGQSAHGQILNPIMTALLSAGIVALVGFCGFMRLRYIWWPFHPVGLVTALPFGMEFSSAAFAIWLVKVLVFRYGGARVYRFISPFFVGWMATQAALPILHLIFGTFFRW